MVAGSIRRRNLRSALVAALMSGLVVSTPIPAFAVEPVPDRTAPVVVDSGITAGQTIPAVFTFMPVVTDDVGVVRLEAYLGVWALRVPCQFDTANPTSPAAFCKVLTNSMPDGSETYIVVRAFDAAGNQSPISKTPVRVDNTSPTAALSPAVGSSVTSGPVTVTLSGLPGDIKTVEMLEGHSLGKVMDARTEGPWAFTWNAVDGAPTPLFRLTDQAGNVSHRASEYLVDDEAPIIERVDFLGSYSQNRLDLGGGWAGEVSHLKATVHDESRIAGTEWRVNGEITSNDSRFYWNARTFPHPTAEVTVKVRDAAGHTSSKSFVVNIDKKAPAMAVYPAQGTLVRGATLRTWIKATDPHGIAYTALTDPATSPGTSFTIKSGRDGARTLTWMSIDTLGNYAYAKRTVIVDNTAPGVAFKKAPKSTAKLKTTTKLTAAATDRNGIARVQLLVNGKVVAADTKATYSFTLNPKKYGKKFTVQLRAFDKASNVKYTAKRTYRR